MLATMKIIKMLAIIIQIRIKKTDANNNQNLNSADGSGIGNGQNVGNISKIDASVNIYYF